MKKTRRLFSLDLLRGLDMLLLVAVAPLIQAMDQKVWNVPQAVTDQLVPGWNGVTLGGLIMPLFIFICGAAVPLALGTRLDEKGRPTGNYWWHVALRVGLLWFCGMLCQGNLASLDWRQISPYNNTLQAIAAGYLIAAVVFAVPMRFVRWLAPFVLAGAYGALLACCGDYTEEGNFAQVVEQRILGWIVPAGSGALDTHGDTWFLPTLMFGAMALFGVQSMEILRGGEQGPTRRRVLLLLCYGAGLLGLGWALAPVVPVIRPIFTVSFTAQAMGWSMLALAALAALTDLAGCRRGWWLVTLYGQCALTAYLAMQFFRPALDAAAETIAAGVPHLIGETYQPFVLALVSVVLLTLVLVVRRRLREAPAEVASGPVPQAVPGSVPQPMPPRPMHFADAPAAMRTYAKDGGEGKPMRSVKTTLKLHARDAAADALQGERPA